MTNPSKVLTVEAALIGGVASAFFHFLQNFGCHENDSIVREGTGKPNQPQEHRRYRHGWLEQVPDAAPGVDWTRRSQPSKRKSFPIGSRDLLKRGHCLFRLAREHVIARGFGKPLTGERKQDQRHRRQTKQRAPTVHRHHHNSYRFHILI